MNLRPKSQSTTLNLWLINQVEKQESLNNRVNHWAKASHAQIADVVPAPSAGKWANTSINHNIRQFLRHNDLPDSRNPFNDHSRFDSAAVVWEGWMEPTRQPKINPGRGLWDSLSHFSQFECIFNVCSYDKESPVCLDRHGRILDGYYRWYTIAHRKPGYKVYVKIYDFE